MFFPEVQRWIYTRVLKPIFFCLDPEKIHETMGEVGERLGSCRLGRAATKRLFAYKHPALEQTIAGIRFSNPVGLAAGWDYEGNLPSLLGSIGFGFGTVGTVTNGAYEGNPLPRLGRLPKSRSLLVNKGFKNRGIHFILQKVETRNPFDVPIGLSIGKTNGPHSPMTQEEAIKDVVEAFQTAEKSRAPFTHYELNISCPNLFGCVEFYSQPHLSSLLQAVTGLRLSKPLFLKMPINESDVDTEKMLDIIVSFPVQGVIFGNLQKNRQDPSFNPEEMTHAGKGNFSGKPTKKRSNELLRLTYKKYGKRLILIGCGGIFCAEDAYAKIRAGASLVQLITGMIFEGPEIIGLLNRDLVRLLKRDGFRSISDAIGTENLPSYVSDFSV